MSASPDKSKVTIKMPEVPQKALCVEELSSKSALEKLRKEISKGWDAPISKRSVRDIINAKQKSINLYNYS